MTIVDYACSVSTCLPSLMETCFANISNIFVAERSFEHITMTQSDGSDIL